MVKMPRFETYCLEMGVKTLVTETGQQLPPSSVCVYLHIYTCIPKMYIFSYILYKTVAFINIVMLIIMRITNFDYKKKEGKSLFDG